MAEGLAIERTTTVDRSLYAVGAEVYHAQREQSFAIVAIDWDRGSGPLICQALDPDPEEGPESLCQFNPWEVQLAPTFDSVEDVERYLSDL